MSLKRKLDGQQLATPMNFILPSHPQASSSATATAVGSFPGFPVAGQSAGSIIPVFPTTAAQTGNQSSDKLRRLRPPSSAIVAVQQEDAKDIAGFYLLIFCDASSNWGLYCVYKCAYLSK